MAKPRTTRFRPKNRKQPRTTRPLTFYEMTERHIIHSKFQWRTSQLDQRRSRLVLDTYGEGTFSWSFRTSKGQRRTMPKRLFQNCLLENKVNVVVPDGPEPINEEGVSLAEESESSHLSRLISSDGRDEAPISTDQTNFEGTIKLNSDGCKRNHGPGGFGGLLRDERGAWICGYYGRMDSCTSLEAELWAVYKGLTIIIQKGFNKVIVETDTEEVAKLLEEGPWRETPVQRTRGRCKDNIQ